MKFIWLLLPLLFMYSCTSSTDLDGTLSAKKHLSGKWKMTISGKDTLVVEIKNVSDATIDIISDYSRYFDKLSYSADVCSFLDECSLQYNGPSANVRQLAYVKPSRSGYDVNEYSLNLITKDSLVLRYSHQKFIGSYLEYSNIQLLYGRRIIP